MIIIAVAVVAVVFGLAALPQARPFGVYTVANGRAIMAGSVSE